MRVRLGSPVLALALVSGCYLSHERASPDAAGLDARTLDAPIGAPDARERDAGPPRALRWVPLADAPDAERPPSRAYHFAVLDPAGDRMIVLGGIDSYCCGSPGHRNDVWALDLGTERWHHLGDLDRPLLGTSPIEAALDLPRNRIVIVGATDDFGGRPPAVLAIDLTTLAVTPLPAGPWPPESVPVRVAVDAEGGRIVVNDAYFIDRTEGVWMFELATDCWATVAVEGSPGQLFHTPLTMVSRNRGLIYSGYDGDDGTMEVWELDSAARRFSLLDIAAEMGGRFTHRAIFEPTRGTLVVFGGSRFTVDRHTLVLDLPTRSVREPALTPAPGSRRDRTIVLDAARRRAIVFGGAYQSERALDDTWALELP